MRSPHNSLVAAWLRFFVAAVLAVTLVAALIVAVLTGQAIGAGVLVLMATVFGVAAREFFKTNA